MAVWRSAGAVLLGCGTAGSAFWTVRRCGGGVRFAGGHPVSAGSRRRSACGWLQETVRVTIRPVCVRWRSRRR